MSDIRILRQLNRLGDSAYSEGQNRRLDTFEASGWKQRDNDWIPFVEKDESAENNSKRLPKWPVRNSQLGCSDDDRSE